MTTLDKVAQVRDRLAQAMAADELGKIAFASRIKKERLREIATGKAPGFDEADRVCTALAKLNGGAAKPTNGKATETPEPDAEPLPEKPKGRAARVTAGAEPATPKRKRTSQRGGRQIGIAAAKAVEKRQASRERLSKPIEKRLMAGSLTKARRNTSTKPGPEPIARPKAAKATGKPEPVQHADSQKISVLVKKNPHREGFRNGKLFGLLKDGMTVKSFRQKVEAEGLEVRNWLNWSIGLKHIAIK